MTLKMYTPILRQSLDREMRRVVDLSDGPGLSELRSMLAYHLGWEGEKSGPEAQGKRIRPLLVMLTCGALGGSPDAALPAAASVELIHNFSLIHDDIEDSSDFRHGRLTVWKKWGIPQAINAGDLMFTLAFQAMLRLENSVSSSAALEGTKLLQSACIQLTQGQYQDISFENRNSISLTEYWKMVGGKTAALLACATELGALSAQANPELRLAMRTYGNALGLAFQAWDDWLGIWGDSALTGKSTESDLVSGKKSLPVVFGLSREGKFAQRWKQGPINPNELPEVIKLLEDEGAKEFTAQAAGQWTDEAMVALNQTLPNDFSVALRELTEMLLHRKQ